MEAKWIAVIIVGLFIISGPILFNVFGKEDGCGRSWWDRFIAAKKAEK